MDGSNVGAIPRQRQGQPNMIYSTDLEAEQGMNYSGDPRAKMQQGPGVPPHTEAQPWMYVPTTWSADTVGPPPPRNIGLPHQHVPGGVGPGGMGWGVAPNHALRGLVAESSHDASSHASSLEDIGNDFDPERTMFDAQRMPKRQTEEDRLRARVQELEAAVATLRRAQGRGGAGGAGGRERELEEEVRAGREREEELRRRMELLQNEAERSSRLMGRLESALRGRMALGGGGAASGGGKGGVGELVLAEALVAEMEREVRASAAATPWGGSPGQDAAGGGAGGGEAGTPSSPEALREPALSDRSSTPRTSASTSKTRTADPEGTDVLPASDESVGSGAAAAAKEELGQAALFVDGAKWSCAFCGAANKVVASKAKRRKGGKGAVACDACGKVYEFDVAELAAEQGTTSKVSASSSELVLKWKKGAGEWVSGSEEVTWEVQMSDDKGKRFRTIAQVGEPTARVAGLKAKTSGAFRVVARSRYGASAPSEVLRASTGSASLAEQLWVALGSLAKVLELLYNPENWVLIIMCLPFAMTLFGFWASLH